VVAAAAAAPAPFTQEPVAIDSGAVHLAGTLVVPTGPGPFPVALIVAGSGPTDRDGNGPMLKTDAYRLLAEDLAGRGIATLRYDKRGVGASKTPQSESELRFDDFVADALTLAKYLETDRRFAGVSIVGHSEGSLIAMIAAQRDSHVKSVVSLEGAGRDAATIVDEQVGHSGASPTIVSEVESIDKSLRAGTPVPSPDPKLAALFRPSVQPYLISWYKFDPAAVIAMLSIPVLIVQGTTDIQVTVADAKALAAADPHAQLLIVPGANHVLRDAPADRAGNIATYNEPQLPLNPAIVDAVATFLTRD